MNQENETICCACGCGNTLLRYWYEKDGSHRKERRYIHGHNTPTNRIERRCNYCGKRIMIHVYRSSKRDTHYCNKDCRALDQIKQLTRECINCKTNFNIIPARSSKAKYCSKKCRLEYESVTRPCSQCGKDVTRGKSTMAQERIYCSRKCQHVYQSIHFRRENHPRWRNYQGRDMGKNWPSQRKAALKRDNYNCQDCGKLTNLDVHHIIPARCFTNPDASNEIGNLVTLCGSCHNKAEAIARRKYPPGFISK